MSTAARASRILPQSCSFVAQIFDRETYLRRQLPTTTEPNIASGLAIAAAELAKLRHDHSNICTHCAAIEDGRLRVAA